MRSVLQLSLGLVLVASVAACGSSPELRARAPTLAQTERASCAVAARQNTPLLVEWPASEKVNLEARLQGGAVAVEYTGCTMRLLTDCRLPGGYRWQHTSTATDVLDITSGDELFTKLPLGALNLQGELTQSGRLSVQTTVGGQMRLEGITPDQVPEQGGCSRATHLVSAVSIGSFSLSSGGARSGGAAVGAGTVGAGAHTTSSETVLRYAGDGRTCRLSTDEAPHAECRSPIQAFLTTLPRALGDQGPPGSLRVTFVSSNSDQRWEVRNSGKTLCTTPCSEWVDPLQTLRMRAYGREGPSEHGETVDLPDLRQYADQGGVRVEAQPTSQGAFVGGIVGAGVGGAAIFFGGFFALFGSMADRPGMTTGGAVAAAVGGGVATVGVVSIALSGPGAEVTPEQAPPSAAARPVGIELRAEF